MLSYGLHGKFIDFLNQMDKLNYKSAYHSYYKEKFGKETQPTLYLQGKKDKPYHIDYIFGNQNLVERIELIKVGKWINWYNWSDHMPIYAKIKINEKQKHIESR